MVLRGFKFVLVCAILGFGSKHLAFNNKALPMPAKQSIVYVIHLPIATILAYHVVRWPIGVPLSLRSLLFPRWLSPSVSMSSSDGRR